MFPIQANQFAAFDAEFDRNDRLEHESESDTVSVGLRHQEGPRQRRRLVFMSSGTVATVIDSPDSHDERLQRVRRAMQERPVEAVPAANQRSKRARSCRCNGASQDGGIAGCICDVGLRHFARLDEEAPFCHEERALLPQGFMSTSSAIGNGGSSFGGRHPLRAGLEIDAVAPTHVAAPFTSGRFDCQGQVAQKIPIICQR